MPLKTIALAAVPIVLVFAQPDAGTALVYIAVLRAVLFVAGIRWLHLALIAVTGIVAVLAVLVWLPAMGVQVLKPYQTARLSNGNSYNLTESKIAIGAGGVNGRGVNGATQTALDYLPAHDNDFAFASLAEQRGFLGVSAAAPAVSADRLARAEDRHDRSGSVRRDRRGRGRVRAALPGVRQRRHDDGDRADHRDHAAVRVSGRLLDDLEPDRHRRAALDPRPRRAAARFESHVDRSSPLRAVQEARRGIGLVQPIAVCGARELVPLLVKELGEGGDASSLTETLSRDVAALVWIGKPDDEQLRAASRAHVPIVGVTEGQSLPYVLDTNIVRIRPGRGLPVEEIAAALARVLGQQGVGLAARLPVLSARCRRPADPASCPPERPRGRRGLAARRRPADPHPQPASPRVRDRA